MIKNYITPKFIKDSLDLEKYIHLGVTTESIYIDFKRSINFSSSKKQELAKELALDICQFLNTWGGVLLIGIQEDRNSSGQKVAKNFIDTNCFDELSQFINDSVLTLIYPKGIDIELVSVRTPSNENIIALNLSPTANLAYVCDNFPPYSPQYPYRTHYGKKYFHPLEIEQMMSSLGRSVPIKLENLRRTSNQVTLYPKVKKETLDNNTKWDSQDVTVVLTDISNYEFTLKVGGISINIPFSLVKDIWLTENATIGIILNAQLSISSNRKNINLEV